MKILLIGASGQLGADIVRNNTAHDIVAPKRAQLDLENAGQIEAWVKQSKADLVINCAAFHNVPLCEDQPDRAFRVNCVAVGHLAHACALLDARLVTFSTDYVFDGCQRTPYLENDLPGPVQVYGITRVAGEYAAMAAAPEHAIVIRTCGLYGRAGSVSKGGNFVDKRVAEAASITSLEMACEQTIGPTSTDDLSRAVLGLIGRSDASPGIYHLVNEGACSWFEFAKAIYEIAGLHVEVRPVDRHGRSGTMRRPLYSVLANTKARALGITLPPWRDALRRYLETQYPAQRH
ncbi:MAG: dTDP-4-dehydrorhamnose reductase [Betaproteobacteria bacterium]